MRNLMLVFGAIIFTVFLTSCKASICDCVKNGEKSNPDLGLAEKCQKAYGNLSFKELGEKMEECGLASKGEKTESLDDEFESDLSNLENDVQVDESDDYSTDYEESNNEESY